MTDTKSVCKYIFLAERHLGYIIDYDARDRSCLGYLLIETEIVTNEFLEYFGQENDEETQTELPSKPVFDKMKNTPKSTARQSQIIKRMKILMIEWHSLEQTSESFWSHRQKR